MNFFFQLSTQVVSKQNAGNKENGEYSYTDEIMCFCEDDFDDEYPSDAEDCAPSICVERKLAEWDIDDTICFCDDDDVDDSSSSGELKHKLNLSP